ncbi:beta-mannanase [Micromonospora sp. R77]|uniref:glycoside hydrolase family 26 protein n=1 Tax=Micromonospora sp. R77 TaxID=2925836 RepID=UPI001F604423|nr:glycosyl hydrolase [Micromonospora sp. R77]MCI4066907.1 beta-mannanase [Micromonospora sp. R77]
MALVGALLLTYAFVVAPRTTSWGRERTASDRVATAAPSPSPTAEREPFPPAGKTFVGVMTDQGPYDFTAVDAFTAAARHQPQVMLFGSGWATDTFDRTLFDRIRDRGMLPMLGWEPWDPQLDQTARREKMAVPTIDRLRSNQPRYQLAKIARGDFDSYLLSWARGIGSLGYPVAIRFAHEMNGGWYPWGERINGNRPGDYVRAWRHVYDLFRDAGTDNVVWVWSPNARWTGSKQGLAELYPGDGYVDWIGVSGYYGTGTRPTYRSFDEIFDQTIREIRTFTGKPLVITETGASDAQGRKAGWIDDMFRALPRHRDIIGLIWFEVDKELDWRIASSPAVADAFARGVADPRYQFPWSPGMVPRTEVGG